MNKNDTDIWLSDIEDTLMRLQEECEDDRFYEERVVFQTDDEMMTVSCVAVVIPELNLELHEGTMFERYEGEDELIPDWSLTAVYEIGANPEDYLYYEQDGIETTLYNYLRSDTSRGVFKDYSCEIVIR